VFKRYSILSSALLTIVCFLVGCERESELEPLDGNILFKVTEYWYGDDEEPSIVLWMETEKIYPCCNWSIVAATTIERHHIIACIGGIAIPDV
jgi:hypothetical protein